MAAHLLPPPLPSAAPTLMPPNNPQEYAFRALPKGSVAVAADTVKVGGGFCGVFLFLFVFSFLEMSLSVCARSFA